MRRVCLRSIVPMPSGRIFQLVKIVREVRKDPAYSRLDSFGQFPAARWRSVLSGQFILTKHHCTESWPVVKLIEPCPRRVSGSRRRFVGRHFCKIRNAPVFSRGPAESASKQAQGLFKAPARMRPARATHSSPCFCVLVFVTKTVPQKKKVKLLTSKFYNNNNTHLSRIRAWCLARAVFARSKLSGVARAASAVFTPGINFSYVYL